MFQGLELLRCFFWDGYASVGSINSDLSGGCFLLLPDMPIGLY